MYQNPNQSRQSHYNSRPSATIRDGLSVQELKVMTAMRMAQNNEPPTPVNNTANPASTYQTATPQQLQAAGIQPVVINDRTTTSIRPNNRPAGRSTLIVQNITPLNNFSRNEFTNRSAINELSPYHQQLLSRNNPTASSSSIPPQINARMSGHHSMYEMQSSSGSWNEGHRNTEINDLAAAAETFANHQRLANNAEPFPRRNFLEAERLIRGRPTLDMLNSTPDAFDRGNMNPGPQRMYDPRSGSTVNNLSNAVAQFHRGPEVRTPNAANHEFDNGLEWDRDMVMPSQSTAFQRNTTLPGLDVSPNKLTTSNDLHVNNTHDFNRSRLSGLGSSSQSQMDPMQATINSIGTIKSKLLKSNSQPTIPIEDFASLMLNHNNVHQQSSSFIELPREMSPASTSLTMTQSEKSPSKFPMIKSKTAPRLSVSPNDLLPAISPSKNYMGNVAMNTNNVIPGKSIQRESNFLPNEVAESVLDVLSLSNSGKHRQSQSSLNLPFNQGGFFSGTDMNDPRFSWEENE